MAASGRDVDEVGLRIVRHALPDVAAAGARPDDRPSGAVMRVRIVDGAAGLGIEAFGPGDFLQRRAGNKLAGLAIEYIEITILGRLHDHVAIFPSIFRSARTKSEMES